MKRGLNLGCGPVTLTSNVMYEWENSDFAKTESSESWSLDKIRDFTQPFEDITDNSVDFIVAWHIIEHVGLHENIQIIQEWFRVLKPGGRVFIACPDITEIAKLIIKREGPWKDWYICMVNLFGPYNGSVGDYHKWGYDFEELSKLFVTAGFSRYERLNQNYLIHQIGLHNAAKLGMADYNVQAVAIK